MDNHLCFSLKLKSHMDDLAHCDNMEGILIRLVIRSFLTSQCIPDMYEYLFISQDYRRFLNQAYLSRPELRPSGISGIAKLEQFSNINSAQPAQFQIVQDDDSPVDSV